MYLSGLTHRDRLFDVATRWLADRLEPEDGRVVTEIFAFERAITAPVVRRFVADLCRSCHRGDLYMERITSKDEVRAAIVAAAAHPSTRVAELIDWSFAAGRGLPAEELDERFRAYVASCRRTFRVELILTTFEDLVESEFGIGIHEQRILEQRDLASEFGRIARNASSIIEYMLRLATSPTVKIDEIPIKIWGRYIRDTVNWAIAELDGGEPTEWLVPEEHLEDLMRL